MNDENVFQKVEEDTFTKIEETPVIKEEIKEAYITGLPDWDLEPLYETVNRSDYL